MTKPTVELDVVVDAAPATVFQVLTDWRKNVLWEDELLEFTPLTPDPLSVGSRLRWVRQLGARRIEGETVVRELITDRLLVTEVPNGPIRFWSAVELSSAEDGQRTALHVELIQRPRGLLRLLAIPLARDLRLRATSNTRSLKDLVEHESATPTTRP